MTPAALDLEIGFEDDAPGFDARAGEVTAAAAAPAAALAAEPRTPVDTVHDELKAAEVLARFQAQRERWFAGLSEQTAGIERLLREEAAASDRLGGLPGTDHRAAWAPEAATGDAAVSAPQPGDRGAEWQPPLWAMTPVLRTSPGSLRLKLPASLDAAALKRALAEHCPPAWRRERVRVRLEIETRIYWGARAGADSTVRPCALRSDAIALAEPVLEIDRGNAQWLLPVEDVLAPVITRSLPAGVGLLVAVPLIVYELQPALSSWGRLWQRLKAWYLRWRGPRRDRDPTFVARLAADDAYWSKVHSRAGAQVSARAVQRSGALLAPASAPAVQYRPASGGGRSAHVVLVHGGLSSVRNAFEAWLAPRASEQAPLWPGMPIFDAACVWRFEHDSFLPLDKNIAALCQALRSQVIGSSTASGGRIVFLAHSRGGAVVRFALPQLQASWPQWSFHALTAGAPHDGTPVFGQLGHRWVGLASLVGVLGRAAGGLLDREQMAKLKNLERGLAGDIPPGFEDVTPQNIRLRARGEEFPAVIETWGSQWRADFADDWSDQEWHHVVEGVVGLEADGDGLIPLSSAKMGQSQNDASPAFHTEYFHHRAAVAAMRARLEELLSKD